MDSLKNFYNGDETGDDKVSLSEQETCSYRVFRLIIKLTNHADGHASVSIVELLGHHFFSMLFNEFSVCN